MKDDPALELIQLEQAWGRAMVENDADAIGRFMADDWVIVGSNGSVCGKSAFLDLIRTGALTHSVMDLDDVQVRLYGDVAVLTFRGVSAGKYQGHAFHEVERVSDIHVRLNGEWKCVLTQLSRISLDG